MKTYTVRLPKIQNKFYFLYEQEIKKLYKDIVSINLSDKGYILEFTVKTFYYGKEVVA